MHAAVIVFPGSNCDTDTHYALNEIAGIHVDFVWHDETTLDGFDLIVLPGGFSYGDYLRTGAMAGRARVMGAVRESAERGVPVLGICNGFQILLETGLLPGAMLRNKSLRFQCEWVHVGVETTTTPFTAKTKAAHVLRVPIAHGEGGYFTTPDDLHRLHDEDRVVFRYVGANGQRSPEANPNGSVDDIAGICNERRNVVGMMPHPERASEDQLGSSSGLAIWNSLLSVAPK